MHNFIINIFRGGKRLRVARFGWFLTPPDKVVNKIDFSNRRELQRGEGFELKKRKRESKRKTWNPF